MRDLETRHRRAQRRLRTDELRLGFEELADRYRAELASTADPGELVAGLQALQRAIEALIRNPSEELLLQALLLRLPRLG
jgi:DNA polymerase-3 subunit delta'